MSLRVIQCGIFAALVALTAGCGRSKPQSAAQTGSSAAPPKYEVPDSLKPPTTVPQSHSLRAGTEIPVRMRTMIDSSVPIDGFLTGTVDADVKGSDGKVAIPEKSLATMVVLRANKSNSVSTLRLGLHSVNIAGKQCAFNTGGLNFAEVALTEDSARGSGHGAVHLTAGDRVDFKLPSPVECN